MAKCKFLPALSDSLEITASSDPPQVKAFVDTIEHVLPVFDNLGAVLHFAKADLVAKNQSLREACSIFENLRQVVDADKQVFAGMFERRVDADDVHLEIMEHQPIAWPRQADKQDIYAKQVTVKGSLARNLHRLRTVLVFMEKIMANLMDDDACSLSTAVSRAYGDTLSVYHSMIVRGTCNAGFLTLPTRAAFLKSLGETEESARAETDRLLNAAKKVVDNIDKLYDGPMPASTSWM